MTKPPVSGPFRADLPMACLSASLAKRSMSLARGSCEHDNCLGGGFLVSIEDGFLLLAERAEEPRIWRLPSAKWWSSRWSKIGQSLRLSMAARCIASVAPSRPATTTTTWKTKAQRAGSRSRFLMEALCEFLLRTPPQPWPVTDEVGSFWARRLAVSLPFSTSLGRAAALGFADRLGYAFAAGYQEALTQLLAGTSVDVQPGQPMALCATESLGAHPRSIATQLGVVPPTGAADEGDLSPRWREDLRHAGRAGAAALDRGQSRAGCAGSKSSANRLDSDGRAGVTLLPGPATPFVPGSRTPVCACRPCQ